MKVFGGFEHNLHALRIAEVLEYPYPDFPGLNLSSEVLEAMAHHSKRRDVAEIADFIIVGQPLLEARVVDAADSLAYNAHDIDDALGLELITPHDLNEVPFWRAVRQQVHERHGELRSEQLRPTMVRTLVNWQVEDLLRHSQAQLRQHRIASLDDVRHCDAELIGPGAEVQELKADLEDFLLRRVYRHSRVQRMAVKGVRIVTQLFAEFCRMPQLLPERYSRKTQELGVERTVCDYLAGMTDRYAQDEYLRLFQPFSII